MDDEDIINEKFETLNRDSIIFENIDEELLKASNALKKEIQVLKEDNKNLQLENKNLRHEKCILKQELRTMQTKRKLFLEGKKHLF